MKFGLFNITVLLLILKYLHLAEKDSFFAGGFSHKCRSEQTNKSQASL